MLNRRDLLKHSALLALMATAGGLSAPALAAMPAGAWDGEGTSALEQLVHGNRKLESVRSLTLSLREYHTAPEGDLLRPMADYRRLVVRRSSVLAELKRRGVLHVLGDTSPQNWAEDTNAKACRPWMDGPLLS